ncbi:cytochrome P450 [Aspergillus karnatakaensis]|uniref:cytochrome P450 n=1 Tax=Aspergillus karnatakaensis TaxID=1810916 RepID=UPI003CCDA684
MAMIFPTIVAVCSGVLVYALTRLRYLRFTQYAHLPGPPTSLLLGHVGLMVNLIKTDTSKHFQYAIHDLIKKQKDDTGLMLFDLRPAFYPIAVIYSHDLADQISRATPQFKYSVPKAPLQDMIGHVIGRKSFLVSTGEPWRDTRKMFNVAFAPSHLATFIPPILEKILTFIRVLDGHAKSGEEFELGERCTLLTFDVIGRVILNIDLKTQGESPEQHEVVRCFMELLANLPTFPQIQWLLSPRKYCRRMQITHTIETSLESIIRDKFEQLHGDKPSTSDRSVLSLALEGIDTLTLQTIQTSIDSIRTFLFAGYDTTSVLLQWAFYELSRTPRALAATREELDRVLGPNANPGATAEAIISNEAKLNELVYLTAVIKETLRLHPPAGTSRFAEPGTNFHLQTQRGPLCVGGVILFLNHFSIQRDPTVYGESAETWIPERWLQTASEGDRFAASAWRPFERGPRNCIGQDLAMLEARLVLAMAVRRYDFVKVGLGAAAGMIDEHGQYPSAEPLYDTFNLSAKPVDGTRMKVAFCADVE